MDPECLRRVRVKLLYLTPNMHKVEPLYRSSLHFTKLPEIHVVEWQSGYVDDERGNRYAIGIDEICSEPYSEGVGGLLFLFQITTYIDWEIGFVSANGPVRESHRLLVSLPVMYLLKGTHIFLNMLTPWKGPGRVGYWPAAVRTAHYAGILYSVFQKLEEIDEILEKIAHHQQRLSKVQQLSWDFQMKAFINSLEVLEGKLNSLLDRYYHQVLSRRGEDVARNMQRLPHGTGLFPGSRYA